ncbi:MAG: hypothetical protein P8Y93_10335, partial [Acidobacteriota bacterium]
LTLTPQIIRFPDIEEEDLAPVWVGTESRISFSGSSPRVQSGRTSRSPFEGRAQQRREGDGDEGESAAAAPSSRRPTAPQRVDPSEDNKGVDLSPSGGTKSLGLEATESDLGWEEVPEFEQSTVEEDLTLPPLLVATEPSVVSLSPGEETVLQIVVRGGSGTYRLPLGLSFDPVRISIQDLKAAPGVEILSQEVTPDGWIDLDLVISNGIESGQAVAAIRVQALNAGPAPLVFTVSQATNSAGTPIPVAASDGALFVNPNGLVREDLN